MPPSQSEGKVHRKEIPVHGNSTTVEGQKGEQLPVWEETDYHKTRSSDYLRAKEELEFLKGVESGGIRVPESVKELIVKGLDRDSREGAVSEFESRRQEHQERRDSGSLASQAERTHSYSTRLAELISKRGEKEPIPIAVVYRSPGGEGRIEVRIPMGLAGGPISEFLRSQVQAAAVEAGFRLTSDSGPGSDQELALTVDEGSHQTRAELLQKQGAFRESLTTKLASSALKGVEISFRILDIRDFEV